MEVCILSRIFKYSITFYYLSFKKIEIFVNNVSVKFTGAVHFVPHKKTALENLINIYNWHEKLFFGFLIYLCPLYMCQYSKISSVAITFNFPLRYNLAEFIILRVLNTFVLNFIEMGPFITKVCALKALHTYRLNIRMKSTFSI